MALSSELWLKQVHVTQIMHFVFQNKQMLELLCLLSRYKTEIRLSPSKKKKAANLLIKVCEAIRTLQDCTA